MRRSNPFWTVVVLSLCLLVLTTNAAAQKPYNQLKYPALKELKLPKVDRSVLPNGMVLYLVEDHRLPTIEGTAIIRTGARFEPGDKVGLAEIAGQVMRTGGSTTRKGEQIDEELEGLGASVETSIRTERGSASMFVLKQDVDRGLTILADLLINPAFPQDKIDLAKVQLRTQIARRNDNVLEIAGREFSKLLYGADSPYARVAEYATVDAIRRDDLVAFHHKYFHPNHVLLGLWGDFDAAAMKAKVAQAFKDWKAEKTDFPPMPAVPKQWKASVNLIRKEDINQTNIRMGHLGGQYNDADYYALNVMGKVLGGGLSARLFRHVRSDMGLAYAVFGDWDAEFDHPGTFFVFCNTKSETTYKAIDVILKELRDITTTEVTAEELRVAKDAILNSFVFNFDSTGKIVRRMMEYEYFGYPADYLEKFKANIEKVTAADILRAAREHIHPDELAILAVGREKDFDKPLSELGKVNLIDITIPEPKATAATASPESLQRGRAILANVLKAAGGASALSALRDLVIESTAVIKTPQGELKVNSKSYLVLPNKIRMEDTLPFGQMVRVWDGATGWMKTPQGVQDLPESLKQQILQQIARNTVVVLLEAQEGRRPVSFVETTQVEGKPADVIEVSDNAGSTFRLFVDPDTGRPVKKAYKSSTPMGPVEVEEVYSDYREAGGLSLPFKIMINQQGKLFADVTVESVKVNSSPDAALFAKEEKK